MSAPTNQPIDKQRGILAILVRPFWMFLGNFILMICAANIIMGESNSTRTSDIIFWFMVSAMIIVRFLDIKFLDGLTVEGKPASLGHWRRYAIVLVLCSAVIWAAVHIASTRLKS
jgi:hypothetical protein